MSGSVLADTSAWVEFLRSTGSPADRALETAMRDRTLLVTGPVLMELLAGATDAEEWRDLQRLTFAFDFTHVQSPADWIDAGALRRRMRSVGTAVPSQVDCLIAVIAMRVGAALLHKDADFDAIADVAPLRLA